MVCVLVQWSKMQWCVCWYSGVRCRGVCVGTVELDAMVCVGTVELDAVVCVLVQWS